jgi:hypothetical protein
MELDGNGMNGIYWKNFGANIVYLVDIVDGISNFSGGIKREA